MTRFLVVLALLAGCAAGPPLPPPDALFHDELFASPATPVDRDAALRLSPAMRAHLAAKFSGAFGVDRRQRLVDALARGDLKLDYDAAVTRTAAETFDARAGNCLSLVLVTAAFAQQLGFEVRYQAVLGPAVWDRDADLAIAIGHVNLVLEEHRDGAGIVASTAKPMVVDFLPPRDAARLPTRAIEERTVVAMYLNNRAVESLTHGLADDAYAYAREAVRTDPELLEALVTLAVVYRSRHQPGYALAALDRVLQREPEQLAALSNRLVVLRDLGRTAEADALAGRLAVLDPHPPFSYFRDGMAALQDGRPEAASRLFAREVARAPYHAEFEYWLAISYLQLKDIERATAHLQRALETSTVRRDHDLYADKLARLKALQPQ